MKRTTVGDGASDPIHYPPVSLRDLFSPALHPYLSSLPIIPFPIPHTPARTVVALDEIRMLGDKGLDVASRLLRVQVVREVVPVC